MVQEQSRQAGRRVLRGATMLAVMGLGLLLAGCDKCGDWFGISRSQAGLASCRDVGPRQQ
jgi:hypothetical protein